MAQNDFENKRDTADQKIDLRLWKRLIAYAMRHRRTVVSVMLVLLVVAGIDLAYPQLSRYAIDHFIEGGTTEGLWLYGLVYAALVVVQSLGVFLFVRGAGRLEMDMSYDIRQDAFAKLQQLSFSFYDTTSVGWLMARMVSDIARLSDMIAWSLVDLMWAGVFAVGIVAVLLAMNWKPGLLVLCITPVLAALCVFFQKRILKYQRAVRKTNSRITGAFNEGIMGAMTTKDPRARGGQCRRVPGADGRHAHGQHPLGFAERAVHAARHGAGQYFHSAGIEPGRQPGVRRSHGLRHAGGLHQLYDAAV